MRTKLIPVALVVAVLSCVPLPLFRRTAYLYPAVFTPDGRGIVFAVNRGSGCALYQADIATGVSRVLRSNEDRCLLSPTFSPDGQRLAYLESEHLDERANLMIANADGTQRWMVTDNTDNITPRFVPNTHEIVYLRSDSAQRYKVDVFAVDFMTRRVKQLTHKEYFESYGLSVSPDGRQLLLSLFDDHGDNFIVSSIDSAEQPILRLRPQPFAYVTLATWLSDGRSLLFAGGVKHPGGDHYDYNVYRLTLATGDIVPLTRFTGSFNGLHVSPDGTKAVVLYQDAYRIIDIATHQVTRVPLKLPW